MGLKNYHEQLGVIKKSDNAITGLQSYANAMNSYIFTLDQEAIWMANQDRANVLSTMIKCVNETSQVIVNYSSFESQALNVLNEMNGLGKIIHGNPTRDVVKGPNSLIGYEDSSVRLSRIKIDYSYIGDELVLLVKKQTKNLNSIQTTTDKINNNLDTTIKKQFTKAAAEFFLPSALIKQIANVIDLNNKVATMLNSVGNIYKKTENDLCSVAKNYVSNADSSGNVNADVKKQFTQYKSQIDIGSWPVANRYVDIINDPGLLYNQKGKFKQPTGSKQCTLYANVMMIQRYAMLHGDPNWENIDVSTYKADLWDKNGKMTWSYSFKVNGEDVQVGTYSSSNAYQSENYGNQTIVQMSAADKEAYLKELLVTHPEGIVIYDWSSPKNGGGPHAVLLTDYTDGHFYVADSAYGDRRMIEDSLVSIENIDQIWVVK